MKKKINVIDLDKTLIPYDSFRLLVQKELFKVDLYVIKVTLTRVFRFILPDEFKFKLVKYLRIKYDDVYFEEFADEIYMDVNKDVMKLVEKETDENTINILLSASPQIFVRHLIKRLGWIGSGSYISDEGVFVHLYGNQKVDWVLNSYDKDIYSYNFSISDSSSDDQLLVLFNKKVKWILQ